jgi:hypothetical protein
MKSYQVQVRYEFFGRIVEEEWLWKASNNEQLKNMIANAQASGVEIINTKEVK